MSRATVVAVGFVVAAVVLAATIGLPSPKEAVGPRSLVPSPIPGEVFESKELYGKACRLWHERHEPRKAAPLLERIVASGAGPVGVASVDLARLYREIGDARRSIKWYRAVLVDPHPKWVTGAQSNARFLDEYLMVAREIGSREDIAIATAMKSRLAALAQSRPTDE